jgi:hypothetical protein
LELVTILQNWTSLIKTPKETQKETQKENELAEGEGSASPFYWLHFLSSSNLVVTGQ